MKPNLHELTLNTRIWYKGTECKILEINLISVCLMQKDYYDATMAGNIRGTKFECYPPGDVQQGHSTLWEYIEHHLSLEPPP